MTTNKQLRELAEQSIQWSDEIGEQEWYCADDFYAPRISAPDSRFIAAARPSVVLELLNEIEAMQAECEQLRKDAERYRWLRDGCDQKASEATRIAANCYGLEWDAAIDAAMQENNP